ncbi:MAG: hypothetical protein NT032_07215 [Actinobacteria bacterium]|nr:hypothetical protein [Actinomycetota bacterium]
MRCQSCGNAQAEQIKIRKVTSFIIWFNTSTWNYPTCAMCAEGLYFEFQSTTLKAGWWGPLSFVFTIFNVPANYNAIQNHRSKLGTVEIEGDSYPRPHLAALKDGGVRIVLLIVAGILFFAFNAANSSPSSSNSYTPAESIIGTCWTSGDPAYPTGCSDWDADYRVTFTTADWNDCPERYLEGDATDDWYYACLVAN